MIEEKFDLTEAKSDLTKAKSDLTKKASWSDLTKMPIKVTCFDAH